MKYADSDDTHLLVGENVAYEPNLRWSAGHSHVRYSLTRTLTYACQRYAMVQADHEHHYGVTLARYVTLFSPTPPTCESCRAHWSLVQVVVDKLKATV